MFPNEIWDGLSLTRLSLTEHRTPDAADWEQAVREVIAIETYLLLMFPQ